MLAIYLKLIKDFLPCQRPFKFTFVPINGFNVIMRFIVVSQ